MIKKKSKKALSIEFEMLTKKLPQNPVAKFAHHINKAQCFRDRTAYSRKNKHKDLESFRIDDLTSVHTKGFVFDFVIVKRLDALTLTINKCHAQVCNSTI